MKYSFLLERIFLPLECLAFANIYSECLSYTCVESKVLLHAYLRNIEELIVSAWGQFRNRIFNDLKHMYLFI